MNKIRYWIITTGILGCLGGVMAWAQTTQPAQEKPANIITRAVQLRYADPYSISSTLSPITKANGIIVTVDSRNKSLLLAGSPERIDEMESLIRRMDTAPAPEKDIEITVYLLTAGDSTGPSQEIPPQLDPVLKQLRSTFTYKSYQLLDTIFMRNRTGAQGRTNGYLPVTEPDKAPGSYSLTYERSYMSRDEKADVIHLSGLILSVAQSGDAGRGSGMYGNISTDIDLRAGQMVVVGKTSFAKSALIAVLSARVVD